MNLICVGSVAYDSIETETAVKENILGGSATFFSISASFFTKPHIIAVVGEDFRDEDIDFLKKKGIETKGIKKIKGRTFFWKAKYSADFKKRESLCTELNVFEKFDPEIPEEMRKYELVFLANIHPRLQMRVLSQMKNPLLCGLDTMIYWYENAREDLFCAISNVHLLIINEEEAMHIAKEENLLKALKKLKNFGVKIIIIKRGENGAMMSMEDKIFLFPAFPLEKVVDPTGAGDSFAGAFMGYIAKEGNFEKQTLKKAMAMAIVLSSFCVEGFSPYYLGSISKEQIENRYNEYIEMVGI